VNPGGHMNEYVGLTKLAESEIFLIPMRTA